MDVAFLIRQYLEQEYALSAKNIQIAGDTLLLEAKVLDSVGMLELLFFIEEEFKLEVDDEDIIPENFGTVNNLAAYVVEKLNLG